MANNNDVKWIKISTNVFDDDAFKLIDAMPEADAIELIWFKLLVFAGASNNNGIFLYKDKVAYTDEMLSAIFHRPLNVVRLALKTFEDLGMIEQVDNVYMIPNWTKHQTLDAYEKKKERDRIYQAERREKQKLLLEEKQSSENRLTVGRDCSYSYSISNIIDYLNNKTNSKYSNKTKNTIRHIKARLDEGYTEQDFFDVIDKKVDEWGKDEKMSQYLRPDTLFGTKFESYLNQKPKLTIIPYENAEANFERVFAEYPNKGNPGQSKEWWLKRVVELGNNKEACFEIYKAINRFLDDFKSKYDVTPKSLDKFLESDLEYWLKESNYE